jgi:hypothetical protein
MLGSAFTILFVHRVILQTNYYILFKKYYIYYFFLILKLIIIILGYFSKKENGNLCDMFMSIMG